MVAVRDVLGHVVDHHRRPALPDLVAKGALDIQLAAGLQAEGDVVAHPAGHPAGLGNPGDGSEAHAGGAADHVEDGRHRLDGADKVDVGLEVLGVSRIEGGTAHRAARAFDSTLLGRDTT